MNDVKETQAEKR